MPASFQPVAPPALVAVPVVHVLLFPCFRSRAATRRSTFLDDDDDEEEDDDTDDEDNEAEARRLSHMSRRVTRRAERSRDGRATRGGERKNGVEGRRGIADDDTRTRRRTTAAIDRFSSG